VAAWADLTRRARPALLLLLRAHRAALVAEGDRWQFAVERSALCASGLTVGDLRWLVRQGYAEQAGERGSRHGARAAGRQVATGELLERGGWLLTPAGVAALAEAMLTQADAESREGGSARGRGRAGARVLPRWDAETHTLWWRGQPIKCFRPEAPYQEAILAAFQRSRWARCVVVVLPDNGGCAKTRLHDAIKHLNRVVSPHLRFTQEGNGRRVRWVALPQ
jgi:hypothetical protein